MIPSETHGTLRSHQISRRERVELALIAPRPRSSEGASGLKSQAG